jgi:hypothetical protein
LALVTLMTLFEFFADTAGLVLLAITGGILFIVIRETITSRGGARMTRELLLLDGHCGAVVRGRGRHGRGFRPLAPAEHPSVRQCCRCGGRCR